MNAHPLYTPLLTNAVDKVFAIARASNAGRMLVLLKGFPPETVDAMPAEFARLDPEPFDPRGMDLVALVGRSREVARSLFALPADRPIIADYTAYLALRPLVADVVALLGAPVVVLENDLFDGAWPIRTFGASAEALRAIAAEDADGRTDNGEPSMIEAVASLVGRVQPSDRDNRFLVSWLDATRDVDRPIPVFRLFADLLVTDEPLRFEPASSDTAHHALFPDGDGRLAELLADLHEGNPQQGPTSLLVEARAIGDPRLRILNHAFRTAGCALRLVPRSSEHGTPPRAELRETLTRHWGAAASFRRLEIYADPDRSTERIAISQGDVAEAIVTQVEAATSGRGWRDLFLTSPTGAGKSAMFQIPAIHLAAAHGLVTLVVTPLKALMQDQVERLGERGYHGAAFINSDVTCEERERIAADVRAGRISLLYLSPEWILAGDPKSLLGDRRLGLIVIDEAHCVVTWGRDFRSDYWYLGTRLRMMRGGRIGPFVVAAFTATAVYGGNDDMVFDATESLEMRDPLLFIGAVRRDNIAFEIKRPRIVGNHDEEKLRITVGRIADRVRTGDKCIAYFPWRNQVRDAAEALESCGVPAPGCVSGSDDAILRRESIERFRSGATPVMLATKAFGMGVDIPDVNRIYHHAPSGTLADYIQEIGRAARDRSVRGVAEIDFHPRDLKYTKMLGGLSALRQYQVAFVLRKLRDLHKETGRRNLLVSTEDFAFLFDARRDDVDNRVKSALLMIEKDMVRKYGYPAILVRPGFMFSKVYACVERSKEDRLIESPYAEHFSRVATTEENARRDGKCTITDLGDIFEIDLKSLWERHFPKLSFPEIKRRFFRQELLGPSLPVMPRHRLDIRFRHLPSDTRRRFEVLLDALASTFAEFSGVFFDRRDFERALAGRLNDRLLALRATQAVFNMYTVRPLAPRRDTADRDAFIQPRLTPEGERYHVSVQAFTRIRSNATRVFQEIVDCHTAGRYTRFIHQRPDAIHPHLRLALLLESFDLATYTVAGGRTPELFVRINDPAKIGSICKGEYENAILADMERRRHKSEGDVTRFFTLDLDDGERWDLIERYFLGREVFEQDAPERNAPARARAPRNRHAAGKAARATARVR